MPDNLTTEEINLLGVIVKFIVPTATFILGFFASRLSMTKKERKDYYTQLSNAGNELLEGQNTAFQEFSSSLHQYANKEDEPNLDDFFNISTKGELYFCRLNITCNAIISSQVDQNTVKNALIPKIKEAVERTLPDFYETLHNIASNSGISYNGELKRENYESLYSVYEKHCLTSGA